MYTSLLWLTLVGPVAESAPAGDAFAWRSDYRKSLEQGQREHRPLAVFVGKGPQGWKEVSADGQLSTEVRRLLQDHYLCVYVDTGKPGGQDLATEFKVAQGPGLILSDHSAVTQAFRQQGKLTDAELARTLRQYADPNHAVVRVDAQVVQVSYPPAQQPAPAPVSVIGAAGYDAPFIGGSPMGTSGGFWGGGFSGGFSGGYSGGFSGGYSGGFSGGGSGC